MVASITKRLDVHCTLSSTPPHPRTGSAESRPLIGKLCPSQVHPNPIPNPTRAHPYIGSQVLPYFEEKAKSLLASKDAVALVGRALALVAGRREIVERSLLTGEEVIKQL